MKILLRSLIGIAIVILIIVFIFVWPGTHSTDALLRTSLADANFDAKTYAQYANVSLDEAQRRFRIMETAGLLQADLSMHEKDTFAGLWVEHVPEFYIVVLFTNTPRQIIEPYLAKEYMNQELIDVLEVRSAKVSLAELEQVQKELTSSLTNLRIRFKLELQVIENNLRLAVGESDRRSFDEAVQQTKLEIPEFVVVEIIPGSIDEEPSLGDHFPQFVNSPSSYLDLPAVEGLLLLENGCIRISQVNGLAAGDSFLLIWHSKYSTRTQQGYVHVIDSTSGEILASVGDYVTLGSNGSGASVNPTRKPIPAECLGPYLAVGDFIRVIDRNIDYP